MKTPGRADQPGFDPRQMRKGLLLTVLWALGASCAAIARSEGTLAPAVAVPAIAANAPNGPEAASKEVRNKAIAMRVFEEIFNQGRFEVADEIYARDFGNHGLRGTAPLQEDQDWVHAEKKAFPDLRMTVDMMVAEGDLVAVVWTFRGTHTAAGYGGLPPTGARIALRGITVWRMIDGRIHDEWTSVDYFAAYRQLVSQRRGTMIGLLVGLLAVVIMLERVIWAVLRRVWSRFWRTVGPGSKRAASMGE